MRKLAKRSGVRRRSERILRRRIEGQHHNWHPISLPKQQCADNRASPDRQGTRPKRLTAHSFPHAGEILLAPVFDPASSAIDGAANFTAGSPTDIAHKPEHVLLQRIKIGTDGADPVAADTGHASSVLLSGWHALTS
jgi:hypothetical protein